ncbi:hypothetical protein M413DRAFT_390535 [Hebeloma cylindrosporum]|uniref:Secreted protein n=1 Tax=Hebeloma cylindrosporum TaxID=76867 RepID=A0A0C2Y1Y3_HEBCY|nr:hypothetical protein M413DRAFT_390535 [Hebeloma cylindrosporum h7]
MSRRSGVLLSTLIFMLEKAYIRQVRWNICAISSVSGHFWLLIEVECRTLRQRLDFVMIPFMHPCKQQHRPSTFRYLSLRLPQFYALTLTH